MMKRRLPSDARYAPNLRILRIWMRRYGKLRIRRLERREGKAEIRKEGDH